MKSPIWTILIGLTVLGYFATDSLANGRRRGRGCAPSCCPVPSYCTTAGVAPMAEARFAPTPATVDPADGNNIFVSAQYPAGILGQCICDRGRCYIFNGTDMWLVIKYGSAYIGCGETGHVVEVNGVKYVVTCVQPPS